MNPTPTQLDPTIVNLTKAIRQTETGGNFKASGKSGEYGAYQFTEPTWQKLSAKYGINTSLKDATPDQQNEAAYKQIAEWKAQGKNVGQIASMWNAGEGEPDAYTGKFSSGKDASGVNNFGVHYDVPTYAKSVAEAYQKLKTGGNVQADPNNPSSTANTTPTEDPTQSGPLGTNPNDDTTGKLLNNSITRGIQSFFPGKEVGQSIGTLAGYGLNAIKEKLGLAPKGSTEAYDLKAPTPLQTVGDVAQGALMVGGGPAIGEAGSVAGKIGVAGLEGAAFGGTGAIAEGKSAKDVGKDTLVGGAIGLGAGVAGEAAVKGYQGLKKVINGKTAEEIIATAEKDVSKLTPGQQQEWYKNQADVARGTATKATQAAKDAGEQAITQVKNEINDLNQKIGETSRDTAINLKQPAQQVMKDASAHYVELTGEAADGSNALTKTISHDDLANKIDSKFEYDPQMAASIKNDLGIKPTPVVVEGQPQPKQEKITNQEILDKARDIMQTVSKTARQGNKVYSPAEYEAMQKYSFLMETLGNNGVDMTAANKFWKEYAPVRDKIVSQIKPFDEGAQKGTPFAKTLINSEATATTAKQVISKLDAQNFVSELEKRMNLPKGSLGADIRDSIQGLEKAKLSKETIAQITKDSVAQIKADKIEALKKMSLKQYNTEKTARTRAIIKKAILYGLGAVGATQIPGVKHVISAVL